MTAEATEIIRVTYCPRCCETHDVPMRKLTYPAEIAVRMAMYPPLPVATWTHWGLCPTFDEPIFHGLQPEYKGVDVASLPAPAAPDGLRATLQAFVDRERALLGPRTGQSVGYQPSITPSVLKVLEAMLAAAPAAPEEEKACSCHLGSVCGKACEDGKHHSGCNLGSRDER